MDLEGLEECASCLQGQAMRTAREAGLSEADQGGIVRRMVDLMESPDPALGTAQQLGRRITDEILERCGLTEDCDLYAAPKAMSNRLALHHAEGLRCSVLTAEDPLAMAVCLAAAGNVIDFGAKDHADIDIDAELRAIGLHQFQRFDLEPLRERLSRATTLLYLCDNAGEVVLDAILMETLRSMFPQLRIQAAFREVPILNDATAQDALALGIDRLAEVVSSGSRLAGTLLSECSDEFRRRFETADLVLSKGQGNLSGLLADADERIFFVFRTKCAPVARRTGTVLGSLQLMQGPILGT